MERRYLLQQISLIIVLAFGMMQFADAKPRKILNTKLFSPFKNSIAVQDTIPQDTVPPARDALPPSTDTNVAQVDTTQISGKVTDSEENPLSGVVVKYKGATDSVITDAQGMYSLRAGNIGALVFTIEGYQVKEEPVNNLQEINVSLEAAPVANTATIRTEDQPITTDTVDANRLQDTALAAVDTTRAPDTVSQASGQGTISGEVRDSKGPMPGVSVQIKGTEDGVITDGAGRYNLDAPPTAVLVFTSVGYDEKEELVDTRTEINVQLTPNAQALEEVQVVAVGYGTMNRATLTSSVSSIGSDEIKDEIMPSISQAIQGKAGGVQVTQRSGSPGGGIEIRVRGTTSINASSDPLYVIDGVPVNSTTNFTGGTSFDFGGGTQGINVLSSLNPSDVQSVEVLKDAASSSIYGARAANGVVLITTKRGQPGTSNITFNAYEGFSEVPRERRYDFMNTAQYQDYMRDYYRYLLDDEGNPTPVPDAILANPNINTDWQDEVFRSAPTRSYELAASGGNDKTRYYTSIGYFDQQGILRSSDFSRLSARLNVDHQHSEKLNFTVNLNLTRALNNRVQEENSREGSTKFGIFMAPNIPVYNPDGSYALDQISTSMENPVAMLDLPVNHAETFRMLANTTIEYRILPELALKTNFGADASFIDETFFMPPEGLRSYTAQGGVGARRNTRDQLWINETTLTFDKIFGDHNLNALVGASIQESRIEFVDARRSNFPSNDIPYITAGGSNPGADAYPEDWAIASFFSRVNYGYKERYLLTANFRADGSSRFGANNRWGYFPSIAGAWRISEEDFLKETESPISNLKLRASWGVTGNQSIPNYASFSLYTGGNNYIGSPGFVPNILGDRNLKWETTEQLDIGIDVGLFNNRITLLADYYNKVTSDLLIGVTVPFSSGYQSRFTNFGEIQNRGFEFELTSQNLIGEFKWSTSLNMNFNRNTVRELPVPQLLGGVGNLNMARPGDPLGIFYGWQMIGVNPATGIIDFAGQDGSPVTPTDPADRVIIGDPNPDFFGGITNTFQYKGFDLSILGQFSYGNDLFNYNLSTGLGGSNLSRNGLVDWTRRWQNPGDITDMPRPTPNLLDHAAISSRFVEDGSFFRIRTITLGYNFSNEFIERMKLKNLRVYATVQNAFVFTNYSGYDPEVSSSHGGENTGLIYGYDYGSYPQPRMFTAGVNLTF